MLHFIPKSRISVERKCQCESGKHKCQDNVHRDAKLYLRRQNHKGGHNEAHDDKLAEPDIWHQVAIANGRKGDNDKPERVEDSHLFMATPLSMLDTTHTESTKITHYSKTNDTR